MPITLPLPDLYNFDFSLEFLRRSPKEVLHRLDGNRVVKLLPVEKDHILFSVEEKNGKLIVDFLSHTPSLKGKEVIREYVREWFDLETDLKPFYAMGRKDDLLKTLVKKYSGYRIIGQPDLFESLIWAVMGQQINVQFAYTIKQRFVEHFGYRQEHDGVSYFSFPTPEVVANLTDEHLLPLQFSRQKSKYTRLIAEAFVSGEVSKEKLRGLSLQEAKEILTKIKGVGNWTANYALMKTFRYSDAFPLEDVALHKAVGILKGMKGKATVEQVRRVFKKYKGWEAYATLYLWKSL
jgi:DNA-3-methyladenine glycosylase II